MNLFDISFYKNKKVLITGHTGFKGSWLCEILINAGAIILGYALEPPTKPALFEIANIKSKVKSVIGDIRDYEKLNECFVKFEPEVVFHLAAQPLVREGYKNPRETYEINVIGTVNILECIRNTESVRSFINVTTDKVYMNREWEWGYRESDRLCGFDPYSNSKSCSELVTNSYKLSFFETRQIGISTVRAGNVIGGGDFAKDRIIPDCIRAALDNKDISIRNPLSVRPYQHVLDPLYAYLMIAAYQYENKKYSGSYNIGPDIEDCVETKKLVDIFVKEWDGDIKWVNCSDGGPHEANLLKLDCSKVKSVFKWEPNWNIEMSIRKVVEWTNVWNEQKDISECMNRQIAEFMEQVYIKEKDNA